jgi:hypothetical protein
MISAALKPGSEARSEVIKQEEAWLIMNCLACWGASLKSRLLREISKARSHRPASKRPHRANHLWAAGQTAK